MSIDRETHPRVASGQLPWESIFKLSKGGTHHIPFGNRPEVADMNVEDIAIASGKMANREYRQTDRQTQSLFYN